ncbi:MAG: ABC transporter permease [Acidobacteriota bacterium]
MFRDVERVQTVFTGLAAHRLIDVNLSFNRQTVSGSGILVSGSYFPVLQLRPAFGRLLGPADDTSTGAPVVVLGYEHWRTRLGASATVLDQTRIVNGQTMTIVRVAAEAFHGTTMGSNPAPKDRVQAFPMLIPPHEHISPASAIRDSASTRT